MTTLLPLLVAVPMVGAALLLMLGKHGPPYLSDVVAIAIALFVAAAGFDLAAHAQSGPIIVWFGHWTPRPGVVLGVGFLADMLSAAIAAFVGILFAAAMIFAWGYFDQAGTHFHVLMLLFMAGLVGFSLTNDLFNLFVWFELMSVTAFALTAFRLESAALEGALNFTVINSLGSFIMLAGIGLAYLHFGALDFALLGLRAGAAGADPLVAATWCLLAAGLLIKAAAVPFQFWLADAHAVAPSPVSVIFSGIMAPLGLFGLAKLQWSMFLDAPDAQWAAHTVLPVLGAATIVIGALACLAQRHLKRLLAFSTIAHGGVMLTALGLSSGPALSGAMLYLIGHGLVKGSLFMGAGILLARCSGIDEIALRGRGRDIWPAGLAFALGGVLLAGLPIGLLDQGSEAINQAAGRAGQHWVGWLIIFAGGLTGGAVLRSAGRIYLGWGELPGEEAASPSEPEEETSSRPLWLMLLPAAILVLADLPAGAWTRHFAEAAGAAFTCREAATGVISPACANAAIPTDGGPAILSWLPLLLALSIAAYDLGRTHIPGFVRFIPKVAGRGVLLALDRLHSGVIGDYVTWLSLGMGALILAVLWL